MFLGKASPAEAQIRNEDKSYFFSASFIASMFAYSVGTQRIRWAYTGECRKMISGKGLSGTRTTEPPTPAG